MVSDRSNGVNWRIIAALAGLVVGLALGAIGTSLYYAEQQQQKTVDANANPNNHGKRAQQYLTPRSGVPASVESAISNPQPATGQDHEKRDLAAQEASAAFAWWMVVVSAFGFGVTTIGTILLYQQIRLTREAVDDTGNATAQMARQTKIAEAAQRPYLHVESMGWHKPEYGRKWIFLIGIKNFGQTPASGVSINADVKFSTDNKAPMGWNIRSCRASNLIPQTKIETVTVRSSDTRINEVGQATGTHKEDLYCRFEIRYLDSFGNQYGLFETHYQRRDELDSQNAYRFFSAP